MKKVFYSIYTKIGISILCVLSIVCALNTGLNSFEEWNKYEKEVYCLEDRFEDSYYLKNEINYTIYRIYDSIVLSFSDNSYDLKTNLSKIIDNNHYDYSLIIDGNRITNKQDSMQEHMYYHKLVIGKDGIREEIGNPEEGVYIGDISGVKGHDIEIYIGAKKQYVESIQDVWSQQKILIRDTFKGVTYWILIAWVCLVYLLFAIGKNEEEEIKTYAIDRMYMECNVFIMVGIVVGFLFLFVSLINYYWYNDFSFELLKFYIQIITAIASSVVLVLLFSIIRNVKNKTFMSRCLIVVIFKYIVKVINDMIKRVKKIINEIMELSSNHMNLMIVGVLFLYTAIIGFFGIRVWYEGILWCILGILLCVIFSYFVLTYLNALEKIKIGVNKIRTGDLEYKIAPIPFKDLDSLKEGINDISSGLQASVNKTLKAERLKTELITNVSHDLKTPLTSIISYTQLLSQVENLPEEARDYITIIDNKSQRLKSLTQDLFDISKVQSGNEKIVLEILNVKTLLSQSLAEYEKELKDMIICTKIEEDLYICSDGRKMSRVISNLLGNIIKYTMPHTRVFIDAYSKENKIFVEMKNISSYPLDFDKEEIMQRFKRGDDSRSVEGHGLGLAIVKSYVEVTGGKFDIVLDGDMFKAVLEYKKEQNR